MASDICPSSPVRFGLFYHIITRLLFCFFEGCCQDFYPHIIYIYMISILIVHNDTCIQCIQRVHAHSIASEWVVGGTLCHIPRAQKHKPILVSKTVVPACIRVRVHKTSKYVRCVGAESTFRVKRRGRHSGGLFELVRTSECFDSSSRNTGVSCLAYADSSPTKTQQFCWCPGDEVLVKTLSHGSSLLDDVLLPCLVSRC